MGIVTFDHQLQELPDEVTFCRNCVVSNQRPRTEFDENGVCSACQWAYEKDFVVDWSEREKELKALCDLHRSQNGSYDVVVPGSGGKDSAYVAHQLRYKYGMTPLCVTWAPFDWTRVGWNNLQKFIDSGFTNIIVKPDGNFHRKLARLAFEVKGDAWEPFTYGQKSLAFHIAQKWGIKFIMYGENGELEYGGNTDYKNQPKEGPEDWERSYFKGASIDDLVQVGLERGIYEKRELQEATMEWYRAPRMEVIEELGTEMHWFSYYRQWVPQENFYYAAKYMNFETNDHGRSESTYTKYASLDDRADGFHFYLSYMKFGLGRCSRDAQQDIRRHHITRDEGVRLVRRYDHEFPKRHFEWFLEYLGVDEDFFWSVMDFYRERSRVWKREYGTWKMTASIR